MVLSEIVRELWVAIPSLTQASLEILATLPKVLRESPIGMEERLLCLVALDGEIQ